MHYDQGLKNSVYSVLSSHYVFPPQQPQKRRKRAMLNVGGVKHEIMWKMLEQVQFIYKIKYFSTVLKTR